MDKSLADNDFNTEGLNRIGIIGNTLFYLKRALVNPFRLTVNEIDLQEIVSADTRQSLFGYRLEIRRVNGKKIIIRNLRKEETVRVGQLISKNQGSSINLSDGEPQNAQALLPDFQSKLEEIFKDEENCISRLVDLVIDNAITLKASDIHFEPLEHLKIRYRIDGVLIDAVKVPATYHARIASRIKVLAKLPTYEKDVPLDGRIEKDYGMGLDLRVSTFPTIRGDKVVIRLFDSDSRPFQLEELGFSHELFEQLQSLVLRPEGVIILTGPSNSGKTTTIYSALERIYEVKRNAVNIATIEDPVERDLKKFSQTQIAPARGLTFYSALRSVLRQDPNVIVVGEIRDVETANTAIRAGMTGHLVITTLHSGTAAGAFARLVEMGLEPFILASSVSGIMAQRLVRKVCPQCAVEAETSPELLQRFHLKDSSLRQKMGKGCIECAGTGYKGRTAIAEMLVIDDTLREAVLSRASVRELRKIAEAGGMHDLLHDGLEKVKAGVTNLEELARVIVPDSG